MEIKIKTLTPIWTGGINRCSKELRETSLIGSLRWWFEALVRGLGCYACDPNRDTKCIFDSSDNRPIGKQICPVCYVFGTTGWQRRFKLVVENNSYQVVNLKLSASGLSCTSMYKNSIEWWLKNVINESLETNVIISKNDGISIKVIGSEFSFQILWFVLKIIEVFGALGSHNSYGFGIIKLKNSRVNIDIAEEFFNKIQNNKNHYNLLFNLPNLKDVFKLDFKINNDLENINIGFLLKYKIRQSFKRINKNLASQLFGKSGCSGKIFISNVWSENNNHFIRIWGFLPERFRNMNNINIINKIEEEILECLDAVKYNAIEVYNYVEEDKQYIDFDRLKKVISL